MRLELTARGTRLVGFGDNGAGSGAEEEPFGDAAPRAAAFGYAQGVIALFGDRGGLRFSSARSPWAAESFA